MEDLRVGPRVLIPGEEIEFRAVRSGGPGGQNVNKVATKVEIRLLIDECDALPERSKRRLRELARNRFDADGALIITSEKTRSQSRNLEDAREKLRELILESLVVPKVRKKRKPSKAAKRRRVEAKRQRSETKRLRKRVDRD